MNRTKLLTNPLPIDRVAARVVRKAKPEHLWRPMPKDVPHLPPIGGFLPTAPLPWNAPDDVRAILGKKRGRMTLIGYAESQSAGNQGARYVVRCDCGNYEFRGRILRWFGTEATDMCRECSNRAYKLNSGKFVAAAAPARRAT